jgi:SAM-dependent methyltransferase
MLDYNTFAKEWQSKRNSKVHFAHDFLEKPAMQELLPDLKDKKVLVLGSGSGEECFDFLDKGASLVVGIDASSELIKIAENQAEFREYDFTKVEFICQKIEDLDLKIKDFDYVYSSLTLHYIENWVESLIAIQKYMKPGSKMLFSVHHPVKWGSETTRGKDENSFHLGYRKSKLRDMDYTVYGDYLTPRPISDLLFGKIEIVHHHKPISQMFQEIQKAGMQVNQIVEPLPTLQSRRDKLDFYEVYSRIPLFIIFEITKKLVE